MPNLFCAGTDSDGSLLGEYSFPPQVEIREHPEFHDLVQLDKSSWPRCLLWHGWLPLLSMVNGGSLWAERYSSDVLMGRQLLVGFDAEGAAGRVAAEPDVWTDGSMLEDKVSGASAVGAFF